MRLLLVVFCMAISWNSFGQSYEETKAKLIKEYRQMDLFTLLNLSTDLLSMDAELTDGYVFMLYQDIQTSNAKKAEKRIEEIKSGKLSDDVKPVFEILLKEWQAKNNAINARNEGADLLAQGDTLAYLELLFTSTLKSKPTPESFENVFNYIGYLIEKDEYRIALESIQKIKEFPDLATRKYYEQISEKLKSNKKLDAELRFDEFVAKGRISFAGKYYDDAISWYEKAKKIRYTYAIKDALDSSKDYAHYARCISSKSLDVYEDYLKKYPKGIHYRLVYNALDEYYFEKAEKEYKEYKLSEAEEDLKYFINRFKNSTHLSDARYMLCQLYLKRGDYHFAKKSISSYVDAISYYKKYKSCGNSQEILARNVKRVRKMNKKLEMWRDDDYLAYSYVFDPTAPIGYSQLLLKSGPKSNIGLYLGFRKSKLNADDGFYEIDKFGKLDADPKRVKLQNDTLIARLGFAAGITKPMLRLTWWYAAVGMEKYSQLQTAKVYTSSGNYDRTEYVLDLRKVGWYPTLDAGIILNISPINLRGGFSYSSARGIIPSLGIGFSSEF